MANNIQRYENFDPASVVFSKMRRNKNGGKSVYINAQGNKKLYIQFPFMRSPFGLSVFTDEATNKTSYSLDLSFDKENDCAIDIMEKLTALDAKIVETVAENSKEWLGKHYNIEVMKEALYKPIIRPGKSEYPSTMKLKILTKPTGEFIPEAYDMSREKIPVENIEKGQKCMCIVDINQIWFIDNKFGVSMRVSQILCEQSIRLPSFAFQGVSVSGEESDNDNDEIDE